MSDLMQKISAQLPHLPRPPGAPFSLPPAASRSSLYPPLSLIFPFPPAASRSSLSPHLHPPDPPLLLPPTAARGAAPPGAERRARPRRDGRRQRQLGDDGRLPPRSHVRQDRHAPDRRQPVAPQGPRLRPLRGRVPEARGGGEAEVRADPAAVRAAARRRLRHGRLRRDGRHGWRAPHPRRPRRRRRGRHPPGRLVRQVGHEPDRRLPLPPARPQLRPVRRRVPEAPAEGAGLLREDRASAEAEALRRRPRRLRRPCRVGHTAAAGAAAAGGGFGGGRGMHRGDGGGPKLAARFVRDVSIFDGTQMAPGERAARPADARPAIPPTIPPPPHLRLPHLTRSLPLSQARPSPRSGGSRTSARCRGRPAPRSSSSAATA